MPKHTPLAAQTTPSQPKTISLAATLQALLPAPGWRVEILGDYQVAVYRVRPGQKRGWRCAVVETYGDTYIQAIYQHPHRGVERYKPITAAWAIAAAIRSL